MSYAWLPLIYRQVAEGAGLEAALGLARAKAGQRISVPRNWRASPWMAEAMGEKGAATLCDLYGGELIDLPTNPAEGAGARARARRVQQALDEDKSANQIAAQESVSRWTVFYQKRKRKARDAAPDLFSSLKDRG